MEYYFGLDGGGTSCRIRVEDGGGNCLFADTGGASNIFGVGLDEALQTVEQLVSKALHALHASPSEVKGLCIGSAGLGRESEKNAFASLFSSLLPKVPCSITTDAEIMLVGGLGKMSGMGLIAGTGSICMGRNELGKSFRSGGFGWRLGDEGSAWWISNQAISRTLRSQEQRDLPTKMAEGLLRHYGFSELTQFVSWINDSATTKSMVASGASLVTDYAKNGDSLAIDIVRHAIAELVLLVESVYQKLSPAFVDLVLYGGILVHDAFIRSEFLRILSEKLPRITVLENPRKSAVEGAVILSKELSMNK
jgi:N-acetylglucosamine kinase-like BadF-type ATPase